MLQVKNISKLFGKQKVLHDINLSIQDGEFVVIMGPSGSGKSTLLHILSGIDEPSNGTILFNKQRFQDLSVKELEVLRQKDMSFVFQDYQLLNTLTCQENVALPLTIQKQSKKEVLEKTMKQLNRLQIDHIAKKFPSNVSGGEKQRVAVARAFVTEPKVLFADEPTGALDSKNAYDLLTIFEKHNTENKQTIVMVSHDPFSASFASRVIFIKDGGIYHTIHKGDTSRKMFFEQIIQVTSMLGGAFDVI